MPLKLPSLPKWKGPTPEGWWVYEGVPRVLWRMSYENGITYWQWWSKVAGAWFARMMWNGSAWVTVAPAVPLGTPVPSSIYPPIAPPQLASPPLPYPFMMRGP